MVSGGGGGIGCRYQWEEGSRSEDIGIIENMSNISNNRNKWSIIRRSLDNDIGTLECLIKEHCRTNNR